LAPSVPVIVSPACPPMAFSVVVTPSVVAPTV